MNGRKGRRRIDLTFLFVGGHELRWANPNPNVWITLTVRHLSAKLHASDLLRCEYSCFCPLPLLIVGHNQRVGALRFASSTVFGLAATPSFTPVYRRFLSLSTQCVPRQSLLKTSNYGIFSRYKLPGQPFSRRYLSLGSIFSRNKSSPSPSPLTVAHITSLESEANTNNHDVPKQLALFQALIQTDLKPGYELVTTRWERMCEFVSSLHRRHGQFNLHLVGLLVPVTEIRRSLSAIFNGSSQAGQPLLNPRCRSAARFASYWHRRSSNPLAHRRFRGRGRRWHCNYVF